MTANALARRAAAAVIRLAPVLIPAIAVIVLYYPASKLGMVWDDHTTFQSVPFYTDPSFIFDAIRNPLIYFPNYYRPLVVVSFLIQTYFFGVDPRVFHITSIALHVANTAIVALISLQIAPTLAPNRNRALLAGLAGLLYALHPALIEPVTFLSSRFDLLLTFFLLLALLADVSLKRPLVRAVAVGTAFLLGALCKEMALGFPLALPLWHLARQPRPLLPLRSYLRSLRERGDLHVYIGVIVAGLIYLALREKAIGYILQPKIDHTPIHLTAVTHVLLVAYTLTKYLLLIFLPFGHIAPAHPLPRPFLASDPRLWALLAFLGVIVALVVYLIRKRVAGAYLFAAAMMTLFPISNIFPLPRPVGAYFAESYLVFPMALFIFATVFLLADAYPRLVATRPILFRRASIAILAFWFAASVMSIHQTIPLWNTDQSLWTWGAHEEPDSTLAVGNLAAVYLNSDQYAKAYVEAVQLLRTPGATSKDKSIAWYVMAVLAFNAHHVKTAIRMAARAVKNRPALSEMPAMYAHYLNVDGQYKEAAAQARVALGDLPYLPLGHTELGIAMLGMGKYKEAVKQLRFGAQTETIIDRKHLAERNLKVAEHALKRQQRGLRVRAKPVF